MKPWIAALALAALPAFAAPEPSACAQDPQTAGLRQRVENIRAQMERVEFTADPVEHQRLLELNAKTLHEAIRELRRRNTSVACRQELMHALFEQLLRHHVAMYDR